jgi:hypothetical protein
MFAMWPSAGRPARLAEIRRGRRPWPSWSGPGRVEKGLGFDLWHRFGRWWPAVGCPAAVAGGRRGAPVSGEVRARAVAQVARGFQ